MKSVLISIQPKWCELIASGKKTIEVRKTRPKIDVPFKCYIYEAKGRMKLKAKAMTPWRNGNTLTDSYLCEGRGKVIGEFICDRIDRMVHSGTCNNDIRLRIIDNHLNCKEIDYAYLDACKLTYSDIDRYSSGCDVYGWHISDLAIYDKPKELSKFKKINRECWYADLGLAKRDCPECQTKECFVQRPPQSWCYVEEIGKGR